MHAFDWTTAITINNHGDDDYRHNWIFGWNRISGSERESRSRKRRRDEGPDRKAAPIRWGTDDPLKSAVINPESVCGVKFHPIHYCYYCYYYPKSKTLENRWISGQPFSELTLLAEKIFQTVKFLRGVFRGQSWYESPGKLPFTIFRPGKFYHQWMTDSIRYN